MNRHPLVWAGSRSGRRGRRLLGCNCAKAAAGDYRSPGWRREPAPDHVRPGPVPDTNGYAVALTGTAPGNRQPLGVCRHLGALCLRKVSERSFVLALFLSAVFLCPSTSLPADYDYALAGWVRERIFDTNGAPAHERFARMKVRVHGARWFYFWRELNVPVQGGQASQGWEAYDTTSRYSITKAPGRVGSCQVSRAVSGFPLGQPEIQVVWWFATASAAWLDTRPKQIPGPSAPSRWAQLAFTGEVTREQMPPRLPAQAKFMVDAKRLKEITKEARRAGRRFSADMVKRLYGRGARARYTVAQWTNVGEFRFPLTFELREVCGEQRLRADFRGTITNVQVTGLPPFAIPAPPVGATVWDGRDPRVVTYYHADQRGWLPLKIALKEGQQRLKPTALHEPYTTTHWVVLAAFALVFGVPLVFVARSRWRRARNQAAHND